MQGYIVDWTHARDNLTTTKVAKVIDKWTGVPFSGGLTLFWSKMTRKEASTEVVKLIEVVNHIYNDYRR